jgi:PIN domain nuclease of toxin-antitoxin system
VSESEIVADSSAILALLKQEPIEFIQPRRLFGAAISTVNLCEIVEKLCAGGLEPADADAAVARLNLDIIDFSAVHGRVAAHLRRPTRRVGLSLGDRACLALALDLGVPVATADRAWAALDIGVEVILIR